MSTTQDRLRGRLETLERVKAPDRLGVLVILTGVRAEDRQEWIREHAPSRPFIVIPQKELRP